MQLYYFETPNGRKPCAVARYLDLPVEYVRVDLAAGENRTPDYLALNPNGKVPTLRDGDTVIWEADAIMCHLSLAAGADLWPADRHRQVEAVRWLSWNANHFSRHAGTLYFENVIKPQFGLGTPDEAAISEAGEHVRRFAGILEDHLAGRAFLLGDALSVADFATAILLPDAQAAQLPLDGCPAIQRWHERLSALPGWQDPFPAVAAA